MIAYKYATNERFDFNKKKDVQIESSEKRLGNAIHEKNEFVLKDRIVKG